jgi:hypothetical protein
MTRHSESIRAVPAEELSKDALDLPRNWLAAT